MLTSAGLPSPPPPRLDATFGALSDPTRRAILHRLAQGEAAITELAAPFAMSLPAFGKHIRVLEGAGLVRREKRGRTHYCALVPRPLMEATEWLDFYRRFWTTQIDALERFLDTLPDDEEKK